VHVPGASRSGTEEDEVGHDGNTSDRGDLSKRSKPVALALASSRRCPIDSSSPRDARSDRERQRAHVVRDRGGGEVAHEVRVTMSVPRGAGGRKNFENVFPR